MADTRNISQPSQGSEELGSETRSARRTDAPSAGTDTQTKIAAASGKHKEDSSEKNVNDDELILNNKTDAPDGLENATKRDN